MDPDAQRRLEAYLDEHGTWEAARARFASTSEDMDEQLRVQALAALDTLERELGTQWPRDAMFQTDGPGAFLGNGAGWTARQVVVTAREFELFKDDLAWPAIVKKLRKPRDGHARSSLFQIHVAALARQRGLSARLEPASTGRKSSDVLVMAANAKNEDGDVYVECTENQAIPEAANYAPMANLELWPFDLTERGLVARVDLYPGLSVAQRAAAERAMVDAYDEVETSAESREVSLEGIMRSWVAPLGHADVNRYTTEIGGPGLFEAFSHDPVGRMLSTIRKKQRQLKQDAANVIALRPSRLLNQLPIDTVRAALREAQAELPMLSAVALFHSFWGHHTEQSHDLSFGDTVTITDLFPPLQEEVVLVWNQSREHKLADAVIRQHLAPDRGAWIDV